MCRWRLSLAPKAPGARSAPDEFLSIYSPFNLISDPPVRSGCSAQPGGPSLSQREEKSTHCNIQVQSRIYFTARSQQRRSRSGQVRFITRPKSRTVRAKRKKRSRANRTKTCAQMSNELESDRAMVMNLESFGVDGAGYDETETEPPSSTNPQ